MKQSTLPPHGPRAADDYTVSRESAHAYVVAVNGGQAGHSYPLDRGSVVLGRAEEADIPLLHPSVSERHARIVNAGRSYEIEDLGSTNGTYVGGRRVTRATLHPGDRVILGGVELAFLSDRSSYPTLLLTPPLPAPANQAEPALAAGASGTARASRASHDRDEPVAPGETLRALVRGYRVLRPYVPMMAVLAVVGVALGVSSLLLAPPTASAASELRFYPTRKANPVENGWRPPEDRSVLFFAEAERGFTHPALVLATLAKLERGQPDKARAEAMAARLRLEPIGEQTYRATFAGPSLLASLRGSLRRQAGPRPADPVAFLDAHTNNYVQTEIDRALRAFTAEADFLRVKLEEAQRSLVDINQQLAEFKQANADNLPEAAVATSTSRFDLETRRAELAAQVARLQGEVAANESQLRAESPLAQTRFEASQSYRTTQVELNRKLSEAYARGLAEENPEVQRLQDEKRRIERLIEQEMRAATSDVDRSSNPALAQATHQGQLARAQLRAAQAQLQLLARSLDERKRMVGNMPAVAARLDDLQRAHESTKRLHDQLFDRLARANLQLDVERLAARSRFEIITAPALQQQALSVSVARRAGVGLVLALALAAALIAWREGRNALARTLATMD
jgi:hypothetical protein